MPEKQGVGNSKRQTAVHSSASRPRQPPAPAAFHHHNAIIYHLHTFSTCIPKSRPNPFIVSTTKQPDAVKNSEGATAALRPRICHAFPSSASRPPHSRIRRLPAEKAAPHGQPAAASAGSATLSAATAAAASPGKNSRTRTAAIRPPCSHHLFHAADSCSAEQAPRIIRPCRVSTARCSHRSAAHPQGHPTRCAFACHKSSATAPHGCRSHSRNQTPTTCDSAADIQSSGLSSRSSYHASHSGPQATRTGSSCDHACPPSSIFSSPSAATQNPQPRGCSHRHARRSREKNRR